MDDFGDIVKIFGNREVGHAHPSGMSCIFGKQANFPGKLIGEDSLLLRSEVFQPQQI
jgi:hypothetical protein